MNFKYSFEYTQQKIFFSKPNLEILGLYFDSNINSTLLNNLTKGRMHGALIGYHNTITHFGFEYVTMKTIDKILFGSTYKADMMFVLYSKIITTILDNILEAVAGDQYDFLKLGNRFNSQRIHYEKSKRLFDDLCGVYRRRRIR